MGTIDSTSVGYTCARCRAYVTSGESHHCGPIQSDSGTGSVLPQYGWMCPRCGSVWAPHTPECLTCNGIKITYVGAEQC